MAAGELMATLTTLPSVKQGSNNVCATPVAKDRRAEGSNYKACVEQKISLEFVKDFEYIEAEEVDPAKITGSHVVTLPDASTTTKARGLKPERYSYNSKSTGDLKLPYQSINRLKIVNPSLESPRSNVTTQLNRSESTKMAMPSVAHSLRQRSLTESCLLASPEATKNTVVGKSFRENLSLIYRQNKEMKKLEYDNVASRQALKNARDLITDLKAKIEKRNKYIKQRNLKEGDLARDVEALRRERDEKLQEYKSIMKNMNQALAAKDDAMKEIEDERKRMESVYQDDLRENTELMRKIETREKQITQLREKTEKAVKWKTNARS